MSQVLTIELPDDVYAPLAAEAARTGKTVAEVAAVRLGVRPGENGTVNGTPAKPGELLMKNAGTFDFGGLTDVSTRHHEYLGQGYLDDHSGPTSE